MASTLQNPINVDVQQGITKIVHRHAHDVRNHLNILNLEAVLLGELISHPEAVATVSRIRTQLFQLENTVKALLFKVDEPSLALVTAGDLLQLWKYQVTPFERPEPLIEWCAAIESKPLTVDINAVVFVLRELTLTALKRAKGLPLKASLYVNADAVVLELREPVNDVPMPDDLIEDSARLVHANGGMLDHFQSPTTKEWFTTLTFADPKP